MLLDRLAGVVLTPLRSVKTTPAIGHFYLGEHRTFLFCFDIQFIYIRIDFYIHLEKRIFLSEMFSQLSFKKTKRVFCGDLCMYHYSQIRLCENSAHS
jgi:hypothetical protein